MKCKVVIEFEVAGSSEPSIRAVLEAIDNKIKGYGTGYDMSIGNFKILSLALREEATAPVAPVA